jgi:2'-5' RNA ligase
MRLFYGVDVPPHLKDEIGRVQRELKNRGVAANKWSDPALFHLTVLFLGEMPFEKLKQLDEVGCHAARQVAPFELAFGALGAFPKNRILWLGLQRDAGMHSLSQLHDCVRTLVAKDALAPLETRPYSPHLTLARQVQQSTLAAVERERSLPATLLTDGTFRVEHLILFESTRENGKLVYPVRRRYALGAEG